jgi:hypothetical protein
MAVGAGRSGGDDVMSEITANRTGARGDLNYTK